MIEKQSHRSVKRGHVSAAEGNSGAPEPGTRSYRSLWQMKRGPSRDSAHTWFHLQQTRSGQKNTPLSVQIPQRWPPSAQAYVWFRLLLL